jgi:uncharacterized membrane protein
MHYRPFMNINRETSNMKKTVVTLACCALIAPLAFAQTSSKHKRQTATEPVTVTGAIITTTTEEGAAARYQPVKTLVVREDGSNNSGRYVLNGPSRRKQGGRNRPDRDQTWRSRPCLLRKHGRFARG